jgi:capsular exopolysaccharide synthesis family protein
VDEVVMLRVKKNKASASKSYWGHEKFLQLLTSNAEVAHSCDTLLSSLHLLNSTGSLKTIMVTSTQPEEGKTTVIVSLAFTMTFAGKKVLVIDADLRKPMIHQIFELENSRGFADLLNGSVEVQDVIQILKVNHEGLQNRQPLNVITTGRVLPNSLNAMGSPNLRRSLEYLRNMYDIVLLDSPPILSVSDSLLLAPGVDGIILVLNTGAVTEEDALRAKERLDQAGGHILGVVMNRFDEKLHGPGFHPYSYYRAEK